MSALKGKYPIKYRLKDQTGIFEDTWFSEFNPENMDINAICQVIERIAKKHFADSTDQDVKKFYCEVGLYINPKEIVWQTVKTKWQVVFDLTYKNWEFL
jgi:hypothetical protein